MNEATKLKIVYILIGIDIGIVIYVASFAGAALTLLRLDGYLR